MKLTLSILIALVAVSCGTLKPHLEKIKAPERSKSALNPAWIKNLDPVHNTGNLPIGTASPFIFQDILYMGSLGGFMRAYDIESGRLIWEINDKQPIQSQVNKVGDYIYYGSKNGRLFVRHYLTGKLKYSTDLGSPIESQPVHVKGRLVVHLRNHTIITLDAKTGKVFWRYKRSIPYTTTLQRVSHVATIDRALVVGFADGYLVSLSLEEGVINWEQRLHTGVKFVDVDVQAVKFGRYVVAGSASGPLRMINPINGLIEKTVEMTQSHTPLLLGDEMIVGSLSGVLYRINKFGKVVLNKKISEDAISSVVPWKRGYVVTVMGGEVLYVEKDTLEVTSTFNLGSDQSAVFGTAVLGEDALGIYSSRNRLYLFK